MCREGENYQKIQLRKACLCKAKPKTTFQSQCKGFSNLERQGALRGWDQGCYFRCLRILRRGCKGNLGKKQRTGSQGWDTSRQSSDGPMETGSTSPGQHGRKCPEGKRTFSLKGAWGGGAKAHFSDSVCFLCD